MKVALFHDFLVRIGGAERVLKKMTEIFPEAPIFTLICDYKKCQKHFPKTQIITSRLQKFPLSKKFHRLFFPLMPVNIERFDFSDYDLLFSNSTALSHGAITNTSTRHISYIHSPARYLWDYTHRYLAERGNALTRPIMQKCIHNVRRWDFLAAKRSDHLIANSRNVQDRIRKFWRRDSEVIYPFVELDKFSVSEGNDDFFLILSNLSSFKRIDLAISVFNKIGKKLIIAGDGPQRRDLEKISASNIDFLGSVSESDKKMLLESCRAFIFPGEEDFGIAPLEANACGKPVIAYRKGGLLESQIEGKTAEFFSQQTVPSLEGALTAFLKKEGIYNPSEIRANAERFGEEIFVEKIKEMASNLQK